MLGARGAFSPRQLRRGKHAARNVVTMAVTALLAITGVSAAAIVTAAGASAAPPAYEIKGHWVNPPTTVGSGNPLVAEWRVNVNDAANPPSNDPVDNVVAMFTTGQTGNAFFQDIPDICKTTGVDPASSISTDGLTLTCNFGTVKMGTSLVVQTPVIANGITGDEVSLDGTSPGGEDVALPRIPIKNAFGEDIYFGDNTNQVVWNSPTSPTYVDTDVEWSLRLKTGSDPGPDPITYHLTATDSNGSPVHVGVHPDNGRDPAIYDDGVPGCTHFSLGNADGQPWSRLDIPMTDPRNTNFVDACTLTEVSAGHFDLTLSGIHYNPTHLPTTDSNGHALPSDWNYIASGSLWFRVSTSQAGSITVHSDPPTYTSTTGLTSADNASDNDTTKAYTLVGNWNSSWQRAYTNSGGTAWDDSYRVSPGTTILARTNVNGFGSLPGPDGTWGNCLTWNTQYLTYQSYQPDPDTNVNYATQIVGLDQSGGAANPAPLNNPPAIQYYTGNVGDPDQFDCGSGSWSTTPPASLASVHAIRIVYPYSLLGDEHVTSISLNALLQVDENVTTPQDVWEFGAELRGNGAWNGPGVVSRVTDTPDAQYPYTNGRRDIVRIVSANPAIRKSSPESTVTAGVPADFTLTYSANGTGIVPPSVDNYVITDVLPLHMTYLPGSASPAPVPTTDPQGHQVLTWTLNGVTTNEAHTLTYQAVTDDTVAPGTALTNSATSTYEGFTTAPATKTVTTTTNGYTQIAKTADTPFIPNLNGDGTGTGSWTVTVTSNDPIPQPFTDTIDILPYNGDGRGTSFSGSYIPGEITPPAGATVYYTTTDPSTLSDDPFDASNGTAPGAIAGNTVGWSTTYSPSATAIRVIGGTLASGASVQFQVPISTIGAKPDDAYVNRAQDVAGHTDLVMRTSATMTVAHHYAAILKKEVQDINGVWHDANAEADYPAFHDGDTVPYRVTVTNVGDGTLTDIDVTDDKQPQLGAFHIDTLASGASQSHEYSITLGSSADGNVVNTACATAATPPDTDAAPTINCDPAGFKVTNYVVEKVADPASGTPAHPGQVIHYAITVTQQGNTPADAMFSDDLTKLLDDADYNDDAKADIGTVVRQGNTLGWTGTVPVGGVATVTYSITVHDVAGLTRVGDADLYNPVTSPGCVPRDGEFPDCTTDHPVSWYTYSKVADPESGSTVGTGDTVTYTVVIVQHGKAALAKATVRDDMSDVLDDASYNKDAKPSSGTMSFHSPTLTWTGDLAVGQTVTITYSVTVTADGDLHLANAVSTPDERSHCDTSIGCTTHHDIELPPSTSSSGSLASTGGDLAPPITVGAVLLGLGGLLALAGIRRRRTD